MLFCPYCNSKQEMNESLETPSLLKPIKEPKTVQLSAQEKEESTTEITEELNNNAIDFNDLVIEESDEWIIFAHDESEKTVELSKEDSYDKSADNKVLQVKDTKSSSKRKRKKEKNDIIDLHTPVNKDGYYDPIPPSQKEDFPFLRGEFIAKVLFLLLTIIILALFLIYFL